MPQPAATTAPRRAADDLRSSARAVSAPRPLQNRVDPFGALWATPERGRLMGNRGGRFHDDAQRIGERRWTNKQWIACVCAFKGRRREVFGRFYTELFFRDEPTALAAGHRPCFECRRAEARGVPGGVSRRAAAARRQWTRGCTRSGSTPTRFKRTTPLDALPDRAMVDLARRAASQDGRAAVALELWRLWAAAGGAGRSRGADAAVDIGGAARGLSPRREGTPDQQ